MNRKMTDKKKLYRHYMKYGTFLKTGFPQGNKMRNEIKQ